MLIAKKIVDYAVVTEETAVEEKTPDLNLEPAPKPQRLKRPSELPSRSFKLKASGFNIYLHICYLDDKPFELFFNSSHTKSIGYITAISRLASSILRESKSMDLKGIGRQLKSVHEAEGFWSEAIGDKKPHYYDGVMHLVGQSLINIAKNKNITKVKDYAAWEPPEKEGASVKPEWSERRSESIEATGKECPECHEATLVLEGGCSRCTNDECGYLGECG